MVRRKELEVCPSRVGDIVRVVEMLSRQQGRNYGPDATVVRVFGDGTSVMVLYRHRYARGLFGFRQDVSGGDEEGDGSDASDLATQIWYAEIEPVPDVSATEEVDGVQWWGDPPFPAGAVPA